MPVLPSTNHVLQDVSNDSLWTSDKDALTLLPSVVSPESASTSVSPGNEASALTPRSGSPPAIVSHLSATQSTEIETISDSGLFINPEDSTSTNPALPAPPPQIYETPPSESIPAPIAEPTPRRSPETSRSKLLDNGALLTNLRPPSSSSSVSTDFSTSRFPSPLPPDGHLTPSSAYTDPDSAGTDSFTLRPSSVHPTGKHAPRPFEPKTSAAEAQWTQQKYEGAADEAIDCFMNMIGLEKVKQKMLDIRDRVETCKIQDTDLKKERFNIVFQGNPGTGKTTVARHYARFLQSSGILNSNTIVETSGAKLAFMGPAAVEAIIRNIVEEDNGGVLFVDEAYQLTAPHASAGGRQVLDVILTEMENNVGKLIVIFVGYNHEMQSFFEHNPGLSSRIPYTLQFSDFEDVELWTILLKLIQEKYKGKMKVEEGLDGLYMRVAIRRLARSRGIRGFGNARAVQNLLAKISERQASRLAREDRERKNCGDNSPLDYFYFTKEDLIGPPPMDAFESKAWTKLQELNRVFFGSPGTGKTTVAKLYGQILADIGLLSNGEVLVKNPSDFIGECLGKSEFKTRAILGATVGKVLIIDEAYMLNSSTSGQGTSQDTYKAAVIDTLVAEVQSVPGDDRCILFLGYEDKLREMFQSVNPGLAR